MSRAGEIDRFREDGFPTPPSPPPSRGSPAVAARRRRRRGGGDPNNVPRIRRGTTAVANAVAFFAVMDAFIRWRVGCCVDNGGSNVLALTACKSRQWMARREREGGGGGRSDEAVASGRREASGRRTTERHNNNKRLGAHDVVGGGDGDGGGDNGDGSWSPEIRGAPSLMTGTAALATVPAPGGVDDADDVPMAVGGGTATAEQPPTAARQHPQWK